MQLPSFPAVLSHPFPISSQSLGCLCSAVCRSKRAAGMSGVPCLLLNRPRNIVSGQPGFLCLYLLEQILVSCGCCNSACHLPMRVTELPFAQAGTVLRACDLNPAFLSCCNLFLVFIGILLPTIPLVQRSPSMRRTAQWQLVFNA